MINNTQTVKGHQRILIYKIFRITRKKKLLFADFNRVGDFLFGKCYL